MEDRNEEGSWEERPHLGTTGEKVSWAWRDLSDLSETWGEEMPQSFPVHIDLEMGHNCLYLQFQADLMPFSDLQRHLCSCSTQKRMQAKATQGRMDIFTYRYRCKQVGSSISKPTKLALAFFYYS